MGEWKNRTETLIDLSGAHHLVSFIPHVTLVDCWQGGLFVAHQVSIWNLTEILTTYLSKEQFINVAALNQGDSESSSKSCEQGALIVHTQKQNKQVT